MIDLNLDKQQSLINLDMRKSELNNVLINLDMRKNAVPGVSMSNLTSRVALVLDYSGSMRSHYKNGTIQQLIERILPIALQFDDDGELDFWIFDDGFHRLPSINRNNFYGYIEREVIKKYPRMGCTNYAPVMKDVYNKYICEDRKNIPSYIIYITDGANGDRRATTETITYLSQFPIFWQFVGIGNERFEYLQKLDDLTNRLIDNADFFSVRDITRVSDSELYSQLLNEFPGYLDEVVRRGLF